VFFILCSLIRSLYYLLASELILYQATYKSPQIIFFLWPFQQDQLYFYFVQFLPQYPFLYYPAKGHEHFLLQNPQLLLLEQFRQRIFQNSHSIFLSCSNRRMLSIKFCFRLEFTKHAIPYLKSRFFRTLTIIAAFSIFWKISRVIFNMQLYLQLLLTSLCFFTNTTFKISWETKNISGVSIFLTYSKEALWPDNPKCLEILISLKFIGWASRLEPYDPITN